MGAGSSSAGGERGGEKMTEGTKGKQVLIAKKKAQLRRRKKKAQ
jgi:hypothetical protein